MNPKVKKNLLDLEHNKNLQYFNTLLILLFTYFIGLGISFIVGQIDYKNSVSLQIVGGLSSGILLLFSYPLLRFKKKLRLIEEEVKVLEL